ncbi:hypothetical protein [Corynebacterium variabile]|uniref:hypothetical protein n=1 Tax=Corynebacterium variabile TaxID=1727 RepID=UPI003F8F378A
MNIFDLFKKRPTLSNDDPAGASDGIIHLRCGECGYGTAKWTDRLPDGDGTMADVYECTRCGHITWSTEEEFGEGLRLP